MDSRKQFRSLPVTSPRPVAAPRVTKKTTATAQHSTTQDSTTSSVAILRLTPQSVSSSCLNKTIQPKSVNGKPRQDNYPDEREILSLSELVDRCSHLLPLRVKAVSGFMAESDGDPTICIDDIYNVHAVKQSEVAMIVDSRRQVYRLPLHTAAKFGLVGKSSEQYSVLDLLRTKTLPPMVAAKGSYQGIPENFFIKENDVLLLNKVVEKSDGFQTVTMIKAFSIRDASEKFIHITCDVLFSTDPEDTQLYLSEILEHAAHLLPCRARLFISQEQVKLPKHLTTKLVTIEKQQTETSLIISLYQKKKHHDISYVDIPTSIDIDVQVLNPEDAEDDYLTLFEDTHTLVRDYDPTKLQACVNANDDDTYVTQAQLLKALRQGYETVGTKIKSSGIERDGHIYEPLTVVKQEPVAIYQDMSLPGNGEGQDYTQSGIPLQKKSRNPPRPPSANYEEVGNIPNKAPPFARECTNEKPLAFRKKEPRPLPSLEQTTATPIPRPPIVPRAKKTMAQPSPNKNTRSLSPVVSPREIAKLETATNTRDPPIKYKYAHTPASEKTQSGTLSYSTLKAINASLLLLISKVDRVEERQLQFEQELSQMRLLAKVERTTQPPLQVSAMTQQDIQNLLDAMDLSQYKESFSREWVDGEVFKELDEESLAELGVMSKLHRVKLMKVITGVHSLDKYMK